MFEPVLVQDRAGHVHKVAGSSPVSLVLSHLALFIEFRDIHTQAYIHTHIHICITLAMQHACRSLASLVLRMLQNHFVAIVITSSIVLFQLRYKRRLYKCSNINVTKLKKLHSKVGHGFLINSIIDIHYSDQFEITHGIRGQWGYFKGLQINQQGVRSKFPNKGNWG